MNQNISETSIFPFGIFEIPVAAHRHILDHVKYLKNGLKSKNVSWQIALK